jgi:sporulation protein YlmC with PRC-barrel domain
MEPMSGNSEIAVNETERLIASDKVEGTAVYDYDANHLGAVQNMMIDKYSGQVAYVVISFGGFLGMGGGYYPLPWQKLRYEHRLTGYVVDLSRDVLEGAPQYAVGESPWSDPKFGTSVSDFYDTPARV